MPPSQLKRLKASLRAAGVTGPQKSKKDKKKEAKNGLTATARVEKHVKLQSIREEFNPFEIKTTNIKHDVIGRKNVKGSKGRPGLSKQIGEDNRKQTLLVEMQKKNKAGGIVDRRFGENDPAMPPEERMLERLTRERQSRLRSGDIFNLDDDDAGLTHFGQSLGGLDEFDGDMPSDGSDGSGTLNQKKRALGEDDEDGSGDDGEPVQKKTRTEIMKEVIAKSKMHKYERQKAKEEDEDVREELDAQMGDIWALLTGVKQQNSPKQLSSHKDGEKDQNREYDTAVREMAFDKRSKPADRTKTEEEKAQEEAERLKILEDARQRRMRGEDVSDDEKGRGDEGREAMAEDGDEDSSELGDVHEYGLGTGIPIAISQRAQLNPDELVDGDYEIDDEYIETGSAEHSDDYDSDVSAIEAQSDDEEFDAEFLADVLPDKNDKKKALPASTSINDDAPKDDKLAYTYPCPEIHKDFLVILKDIPVESLPTVIQRIRVLYNPKLAEGSKAKLSNFSVVLLEHIIHIANTVTPIPFQPLETAMRHLHALAKSQPLRISEAFREKLAVLQKKPSDEVAAGDLLMLTAITTIFPTSDLFHPVVTPAGLVMAKYLNQAPPDSLQRMCIATYIITLLVQAQRLSKRIIPEAVNYLLLSLTRLSPIPLPSLPGTFPNPPTSTSTTLRIKPLSTPWKLRKLSFSDIFHPTEDTDRALLFAQLTLLTTLSTLYSGKSAFPELFSPAFTICQHLHHPTSTSILGPSLTTYLTQTVIPTLTTSIAHSIHIRRPLELHHHRPLPIPSHIPKFQEDYSLNKKSYDPDKQRLEIAKLKAEVKRQKKAAMRELRKDASFIAREKLRDEKIASKEYHAKMARLTAMIQHEEGQGKNEYEREKRARRGKK